MDFGADAWAGIAYTTARTDLDILRRRGQSFSLVFKHTIVPVPAKHQNQFVLASSANSRSPSAQDKARPQPVTRVLRVGGSPPKDIPVGIRGGSASPGAAAGSILASKSFRHDAHDMNGKVGRVLNEGFEAAGIHHSDGRVGARHCGGTAGLFIE
jgi:hypothetical protein